jgi:hypothetical protein
VRVRKGEAAISDLRWGGLIVWKVGIGCRIHLFLHGFVIALSHLVTYSGDRNARVYAGTAKTSGACGIQVDFVLLVLSAVVLLERHPEVLSNLPTDDR